MRSLRFLIPAALLILTFEPVYALVTEIQLTPENAGRQPFTFNVKASGEGPSKHFHITVKTRDRKLSPFLWTRLNLHDGRMSIASCNLAFIQRGEEVSCEFDVSPGYLEKSKFSFVEGAHSRGMAMPGADIYWFYLVDFVPGKPPAETPCR